MPVVFRVLLGKTGNSLRVTLPRPIVEGFDWDEGDEIVLYVSEGQITLKKGKDAEELQKAAKVRGHR
ncbi:MAG: AbrB/MazE/SpoVT family DNA-binding domain-containing protein [Nitrososphaerota archaeon]|nr:AbrB/MazE/SpoVT family DNA-binding domain-containing protein [Nitrososphaerota archaeon]MDG6956523.1 AbrB/MazE/SpoVT family DNA-binding domain-containing protein [Nitrososphaerota archaeon]MDG6960485.1 AbrB/MazE/SpoVT family DNA-binding domain-containing protein [Nitrososphaerota archaeon]MDG6961526.1 AbrB/MazE/SpoVT family DNA-binding domain-containing protein [Nitrososphaerota archaeon]MDG7015198.1 AbrB/MazE/SpoVT family DNA-binding domain-containing protein [Nitrososphaerota archaeon]